MSQKSLLCMCVYDTQENGRHEFTKRTLDGLEWLISANEQPFLIVDNASFEPTRQLLDRFAGISDKVEVLHLPQNLGTAGGLNEGIKRLSTGQHLLKIDNDVLVHTPGWIEQLERVLEKIPEIGILGCKRKDCIEYPENPNPHFRSTLHMVPHIAGEPWMIIERASHIMGTCVLYSSALIQKIGAFYQFEVYGFEDSLYCTRSLKAGFINAFLPNIDIDHIDPGGHPYQKEKEDMAGKYIGRYFELAQSIGRGETTYYHSLDDKPCISW